MHVKRTKCELQRVRAESKRGEQGDSSTYGYLKLYATRRKATLAGISSTLSKIEDNSEGAFMSRSRPPSKKRSSGWEILGQIALLLLFLFFLVLFVLGRMRGSFPHHLRIPH